MDIRALSADGFGEVYRATDRRSGEHVAVKRLGELFSGDGSETRRVVRELRLLRLLRHENIIALHDVVLGGPNRATFSELYVATPLLATDLHCVIRSGRVLLEAHLQTFVYQILRALKYLHSAGVLHRDLKPANVLVATNCDVKLCDFGNSRPLASSSQLRMTATGLTTTLHYRAPEGLRGDDDYSASFDLWSAGCVLAELCLRRPLFAEPDEDAMLERIAAVLGADDGGLEARAARLGAAVQRPPTDALVDLLARLLAIEATQRATATSALAHAFFAHLADASDEPVCSDGGGGGAFDESALASASQAELRALILAEVDAGAHARQQQ
jgi:serine/threonine protein kinase